MGRAAGEEVSLRLVRGGGGEAGRSGGELRQVALRLAARPAPDGAALAEARLGVVVEELPEDVARRLGLQRARGLVVAGVDRDGPAARTGLERLDVLLAVGEVYASSLEDLGRRLERAEPGEELPIRILRIDRSRKIVLNGTIRVR